MDGEHCILGDEISNRVRDYREQASKQVAMLVILPDEILVVAKRFWGS